MDINSVKSNPVISFGWLFVGITMSWYLKDQITKAWCPYTPYDTYWHCAVKIFCPINPVFYLQVWKTSVCTWNTLCSISIPHWWYCFTLTKSVNRLEGIIPIPFLIAKNKLYLLSKKFKYLIERITRI